MVTNQSAIGQFIVYACPVGELNDLIEQYFRQSHATCGNNSAHKYMPHCTLTGFFTAKQNTVPIYLEALENAYIEAKNNSNSLDITIKKTTFQENWHGLELQADNLKNLIVNFAQAKTLTNYVEKLRLKDWLHLSLAYDFNPEQAKTLKQLAMDIIDLKAKVNWELRFYQKNLDWSWQCLQSWTLGNGAII